MNIFLAAWEKEYFAEMIVDRWEKRSGRQAV
jgi:hypothetical protein